MWLLLLIGSFLPVWRRAGVDRPLSTWENMDMGFTPPEQHIPVEEAIGRARQAGYLKGLGRTGIGC